MNKYILSTKTLDLIYELIARLYHVGTIDYESYMIIIELESLGYSKKDIINMILQECKK